MPGIFEIKKTTSGQFHFVLKAPNGEVILSSEQYKVKLSAEKGIDSVRKNAGDDARFERKAAKNGEPYFVLKATNGRTIGQSEMYSSEAARDKGVAAVKKTALAAKLKDLTAAESEAAPAAHSAKAPARAKAKAKAAPAPAPAPEKARAAAPKAAKAGAAAPKAKAKSKAKNAPKSGG